MSTERQPQRNAWPVITLLLLAPVISELLFGVTRISTLYLLIPQIGTWGCAALLIRHLVRARGRGWGAVLLLGIALAVAEECIIQQTSLAPLVGVKPDHAYGRALGVNWVYFLWALGYESVWAVTLPILLTELIFPARREELWIGRRGAAIAAAVFGFASLVAWYSWTQVYVPKVFPQSAYSVPLPCIVIALAVIAALAGAALGPRLLPRPAPPTTARVHGAWLIGLLAFLFGLAWSALVPLAYGAAPALPVAVPMAAGLVLAALAFVVLRSWAASAAWRDAHRCALVLGAVTASMLAGFVVLSWNGTPPVDAIGKLILNVATLFLLIRLTRRAVKRE
jgi:hypothetical protein